MNTKLFFFWVAGFALSVFSCNSGSSTIPNDELTTDAVTYESDTNPEAEPAPGVYPLPEKPDPGEPGFGDDFEPPEPPEIILYPPACRLDITVEDIISYKITNGEIVLTDSIVNLLASVNPYYYPLTLYYGEKILFEDIQIMGPLSSNPWYGFIVLCISYDIEKYNYCDGIRNGKKYLHNMDTTQKFQKEWDTFITYLTDSGKIID